VDRLSRRWGSVRVTVGGGAGTSFGAGSTTAGLLSVNPCSRSDGPWSRGARVATTGRFCTDTGGLAAGPLPAVTLAATGFTSGAPRTGASCRTSVALTRVATTAPRPKRSAGTPTTALLTFTFRYTLMFCTFTTVVLLMTTLFTTRGPPQPCQLGAPTKPRRPHHGTQGSPQPSGAQYTGRPKLTPTCTPPPRKTTSAGE